MTYQRMIEVIEKIPVAELKTLSVKDFAMLIKKD